MNQNEYNFGSWICIPIIAYLSYMVNYLLDGFFQKNQDVLMNGMKLFEQHLDQIMEYPFRVSSYYNERSFPAGVSLTIEIFSPASALNNVDFPTFGLPTMAMIGLLIIYIPL